MSWLQAATYYKAPAALVLTSCAQLDFTCVAGNTVEYNLSFDVPADIGQMHVCFDNATVLPMTEDRCTANEQIISNARVVVLNDKIEAVCTLFHFTHTPYLIYIYNIYCNTIWYIKMPKIGRANVIGTLSTRCNSYECWRRHCHAWIHRCTCPLEW